MEMGGVKVPSSFAGLRPVGLALLANLLSPGSGYP
jgi:hypothetical protein